MHKFLNSAEAFLDESLAGFAAAHPGLVVEPERRIITRAQPPRPGKAGLVSGGGSGHEPLHGGFVGLGMLDAACPGEVFTSPVPDQILAATTAVDAGAGVVHIVKNYTGDVLNFQMAAELADEAGIAVETVLVDDDVAVEDSTWTAGRRGTGATILVEKLAGALAERDAPAAQVAALGRRVNEASRSFAVALTACTVPAAGKPGFDLPEGQMEVGVGIHGEPGRRREPAAGAHEIVALCLDAILGDLETKSGDQTIVLVNGLGGTALGELYLVYGEVAAALKGRGLTIARNLVGSYMTSLDMAGVCLTVCRADDELLGLWDAPVNTPALRWGI